MEYRISNFNQLLINDGIEYLLKPLILNMPTDSGSDDLSSYPTGRLGNKLLNNIELTSYEMVFDSKLEQIDTIETTIILEECLINISNKAKVVETFCGGRNFSVVESFGFGNYDISITGRFSGSYGSYPLDMIRSLSKMVEVNSEIRVVNKWLNNIGISDIIITGVNMPQNIGEYSTQYFDFNAVSFTKQINKKR